MSVSFEFYIGDYETIKTALIECDLDRLDEPNVVSGKADFSLHLEPNDLDLLSLAMGKLSGCEPMNLRTNLVSIHDESDHGLFEVKREWIDYVSAVTEDQISDLALAWVSAASSAHVETFEPNDDIEFAVGQLIVLCHTAKRNSDRVLHFWYLLLARSRFGLLFFSVIQGCSVCISGINVY